MGLAETYPENAEFCFPESSIFEKGAVVAPDANEHDPHIHLHILTLHLRKPTETTAAIYNLFQVLLGNENTEITTTPKVLRSTGGDPRTREYDKVVVEGSQRILSNLLTRLEATIGSPAATDSLGDRDGAALSA